MRESLLAGDLSPHCRSCHIRTLVPLKEQRRAVLAAEGVDAGRLLDAGLLASIRIDVNKNCNLRCVYCAVSQPGYVGGQMQPEVFAAVLKMIPESGKGFRIDLNGHGETTFHPDWRSFSRAALATGASVTLLSNFARPFDPEEIALLARMTILQISLDTTDDALLKMLRRKVSLGTILRNMHLVRVRARQENLAPVWYLSCGVYDKSVATLRDLAWFAVTAGFHLVTFWNLVKYPDVLESGALQVKPLAALPAAEQQEAFASVREAVRILESNGVRVSVAGDFVKITEHSLPFPKPKKHALRKLWLKATGGKSAGIP